MSATEILSQSEPVPYGDEQVKISSEGRDLFVISDLHLAAGLNSNGNYDGKENFFADHSFARFLVHIQKKTGDTKSTLIINGDFVDFLRIQNIPVSDSDFSRWSEILSDIGIVRSTDELKKSIDKHEIDYGLKTNDYKSIYKLHVCAQGHKRLFEHLAVWLINGNNLIIIKGNHDLEWYWKPVRDYLRLVFAQHITSIKNSSVENELEQIVIPRILFADDKLIIDDVIYLEHGHRYENFTTVDGPAILKENPTELNLPFGSFFNRYLINQIELDYPFIDNVRPSASILPLLIRERFPLALKVLFKYVPFLFLIIPKRQYRYALRYAIHFLVIIVIPIVITLIAIWKFMPPHLDFGRLPSALQAVFSMLKNLAFLSLSYFFGRLLGALHLSSPASLYPNAKNIFTLYPHVQMVTFGHTHDPEQKNDLARRYHNTGTWIPVFETEAANVRLDRTYTFLHIIMDKDGNVRPLNLLRWNDDASRAEALVLMDKK